MFGKDNDYEMGQLNALVYFTSTLLKITLANHKGKSRETAVEYIQEQINWHRNMVASVTEGKKGNSKFNEGCDSFFRSMESIMYNTEF